MDQYASSMTPWEVPKIIINAIGEVEALTGRQVTQLASVVAGMVARLWEVSYRNQMRDFGVGVNRARVGFKMICGS